MGFFTAKGAAEEIERQTGTRISPRLISVMLYDGRLDNRVCQMVGRVRLIPSSYLDEVKRVLRQQGKLTATSPTNMLAS